MLERGREGTKGSGKPCNLPAAEKKVSAIMELGDLSFEKSNVGSVAVAPIHNPFQGIPDFNVRRLPQMVQCHDQVDDNLSGFKGGHGGS